MPDVSPELQKAFDFIDGLQSLLEKNHPAEVMKQKIIEYVEENK